MERSLNRNNSKQLLLSFLFFGIVSSVFSQEITTIPTPSTEVKVDSLYREDQFYLGLTYNLLQQKPVGLSQQRLSLGVAAGFLRDMPINKTRTVAIATGFGFSLNNYNQNLTISQSEGSNLYAIYDSKIGFKKNKFTQLLIDVPLEFRWRTSTYESYKFWRIYGGVKFSYLVYDRSVFTYDQFKSEISHNKDFNKFLYGLYISGGFNTINLYAYYGLNSLFKSGEVDGEKIKMQSLNLGIIFYIL